ncbi:MAG: CBS domain-containing protein [Thermoplasmata archaeon]|jgi:predicted transcriptional regulator
MLPSLEEIKGLRIKIGLTQKQLADLVGLSQSYIARLEKGDINPTYENIRKIYSVLESYLDQNLNNEITAKEIMTRNVISVNSNDTIEKAINIMINNGISQLPVLDNDVIVGSITEELVNKLLNNEKLKNNIKNKKIKDYMEDSFPQISENTSIKIVSYLLKQYQAVLVISRGKLVGIITKTDLIKILSQKL